MSKRRRIIVLLFASVALAAMIAAAFNRSDEPSYAGRDLSAWVKESRVASLRSGFDTNVDAAIRSIGTNAIPFLLEWIRYEPPAWKAMLYPSANNALKAAGISWRFKDQDQIRSSSVAYTFRIIGADAASAVPPLGQLMNDPRATNAASRATASLINMGPYCLPAFLALATNNNRELRVKTIARLPVYFQGTNADVAVPALLSLLNSSDTEMGEIAAKILGSLRRQPERVVPVMTERLHQSRPSARYSAAFALGRFGQDSRSAVPELLGLLNDPELRVRIDVTNALRNIAPEVLTNAPPR